MPIMREECLLSLSGTSMGSYRNQAEKQVSRLRAKLAYTHVDEVMGLHEAGEGIFETFFAPDTWAWQPVQAQA